MTWSARLGYLVVGSTYLQIFDKDGRFARRVGREGDGPGKFLRVVDAHVVDGRLVALDDANRAWSIFNLAGDFVERRPYGYSPGPFVPVGGTTWS
ncbi:MAG: 6-bladed beta-propeller [Gemmatimonadota bacterium]|nr:6-bladed beta-propeller [Gemmatimonadota bacterium]